jgi:hypothetical protein
MFQCRIFHWYRFRLSCIFLSIISKIRTEAMFVTVNLQKLFHTEYVGTLVMYVRTQLRACFVAVVHSYKSRVKCAS